MSSVWWDELRKLVGRIAVFPRKCPVFWDELRKTVWRMRQNLWRMRNFQIFSSLSPRNWPNSPRILLFGSSGAEDPKRYHRGCIKAPISHSPLSILKLFVSMYVQSPLLLVQRLYKHPILTGLPGRRYYEKRICHQFRLHLILRTQTWELVNLSTSQLINYSLLLSIVYTKLSAL